MTQAARYERNEQRQGYRSGHYNRNLTTTSGDITLKVPKLKGISFETAIIERYRRREGRVEEALIEMYLAGVSVRRVEDITEALWGSKVSPSTISELNKKAYVHIEDWRNRPLQGGRYPYAGEAYSDFNLVFALDDGYPVEPKLCEKWFKLWQKRTELNLPPLIFHELRHSSATYKLLESGGDVKLVQGDMGHASATVSLDTYAHTQDSRRRALTEKISKEFYGGTSADDRQEQLMKLLQEDPEIKKKVLAALLAEDAQKSGC